MLICIGCVPQRNILTPVENSELRNVSDKLIYTAISEEHKKNVIFTGAYEGFQCYSGVEDLDTFLEEEDFDKYKSFKCICYDYKVRTEQGNDLYVGLKNGYYLNTRVCYDSSKSIVEHPKIENLKLTVNKSKIHHIDLPTVKMITENEIRQKSKFGKYPTLVYDTNQERILWKVKQHFGKLNVTVFEFDIDAKTGEILRKEELPYKRTFWQWIGGSGI